MKILVLSESHDSIGWICKMKSEGHEIKVYIKLKEEQSVGKGIIDLVPFWQIWIKWCDFVICDSNIFGKEASLIRKMRIPVIGPTEETQRSEIDRAFGLNLLESHGIYCGEWSKKNLTPQEAVKFIKSNGGRWCIKPSSNLDKYLTHVSKNEEDAIEFLENNKNKYKGKGLILQKFVEEGHEISVTFHVSGGEIILPAIVNFEYKRLYAGDLGPNTGQMGDLCVWTEESKLINEIMKLAVYFKKSDYSGAFDVAFMANDGLTALEITPRFGYNTSYDIFENLDMDLGEFFYDMVHGKLEYFPYKKAYATGIVICAEGFPYEESYLKHGKGHYISEIKTIYEPGMMLYTMEKDSMGFKTSGSVGAVLVAVGLGKTCRESTQNAYDIIKDYDFPKNLAYRNDINSKFMEEDHEWFKKNEYLGE